MKRLISFALAFVLTLSMVAPSASANTDDITGHYFEKPLRELISKGILGGYGEGVYRPNGDVTRAEFAAFIMRTLDLYSVQTASVGEMSVASIATSPMFSDVPAEKWYYTPVTKASALGIVGGYPNGTFKPEQNISRQEMAVMIMRALDTRAIFSQPANVTFADEAEINPMFQDAVKRLVFLGIMSGKSGNKFDPKAATTRGETAAVISRSIAILSPPQNLEFKVAVLDNLGQPQVIREFDSFDAAQRSAVDNQVVLQGNKIVHMKSGIAAANSLVRVYSNSSLTGSHVSYAAVGTELRYFSTTENAVEVMLAGTKGYVSKDSVNLIPSQLVEGRSVYKNVKGDLIHSIYNPITKSSASTGSIGKAPSFLKEGVDYISWDGSSFYTTGGTFAGKEYQYFQYQPLHVKSNYTAQEMDRFLLENYPSTYAQKIAVSPLAGTGVFFKEMEQKYEVNALYLMGHAIHESAWGTSKIAQDKKNLFGYGAVDSDPYNGAFTYASFRESIEDAAKRVSANYHAPAGTYYRGAVLGNKTIGMNVNYASDPYWGEKIAGYMYRADLFLGKKDSFQYKLVASNVPSLNVRSGYGTSNPLLYDMKLSGVPMITVETAVKDGATWHKIISDLKGQRDGYVYGEGSLGKYVVELPVTRY